MLQTMGQCPWSQVAGAAVYRYRLDQRHQKKRFNDQWEISW
jgi:hypothetical protein